MMNRAARILTFISLFISGFLPAQSLIFGPQEFATWLPAGWNRQNVAGNNWTQNTADGIGAPLNCAFLSGSVNPTESWLFTETFTAEAGQSYFLSYYDKATTGNTFEIFVGTGVQSSANATQSANLRSAALQGASWPATAKNSNTWLCTVTGTYWFGIRCRTTSANIKLDRVACYKDCSTNVVTASTSQGNTSSVTACYDNTEILCIVVNATIDNCATVSSFTVNANGTTNVADIQNARIWYTGASPSFSTNGDFGSTTTLFGTTAAPTLANYNITGSQMLKAGANYFWLTYDVKATATAGNIIDAECTSLSTGSAIVPAPTAPAGNRSITNATFLPASFRTCATGTVLNLGNVPVAGNTFSIPVSGAALTNPMGSSCNLREVRVKFYGGSNELFDKYTVTVKCPDGTSAVLCSNSFQGIAAGCVDAKFRYSANLYQASAANYSSGFTQPPEPFNQGFYRAQDNFSVFAGHNPAGTWQVIITENAAAGTDDFKLDFVELEFGADFSEVNVKNSGDNCSSAVGLSNGVWLGSTAYNPGAGDMKTVEAWDPDLSLGGCNWNGSKDNSQWFAFSAIQANVELSVSGLTYSGVLNNKVQTIVVENQSTPCSGTGLNWNLVSCPIPGSYNSNSGTYANHRLDFTATVGKTYYLVVDGTAGGLNDYYIDAVGVAPVPAPLPVELLRFSGQCAAGRIALTWQTASETNNDYFTVEKSEDAQNFVPVAVLPGHGNSNVLQSYAWNDFNITSTDNYYRLKQTDYNGQTSYSSIIHVSYNCQSNANGSLTAFFDAEGHLIVSVPGNEGSAQLTLYDMTGRVILQTVVAAGNASQKVVPPVSLSLAVYLLAVTTESGTLVQKVICSK